MAPDLVHSPWCLKDAYAYIYIYIGREREVHLFIKMSLSLSFSLSPCAIICICIYIYLYIKQKIKPSLKKNRISEWIFEAKMGVLRRKEKQFALYVLQNCRFRRFAKRHRKWKANGVPKWSPYRAFCAHSFSEFLGSCLRGLTFNELRSGKNKKTPMN